MIPEIGHFSLILALCLSLVLGILPLVGATKGIRPWMELAKPATYGFAAFMSIAFICLVYSFVISDFSVAYVANHSNSQLPMLYKVSATWGGHEGSMLLWVYFMSLWALAVAIFSKHMPIEMVARVLSVMGLVSIGFLCFILFTSDPFDRLLPAAAEGNDLNPLLQDPGLAFHPPMLYLGYVGFSVAFAFAIAALLSGRLDATWARWSRPWTTVAWLFLTLGIALGSWWAYYELGWGGWWFWDPVENASFLPWLVGTALIHSLAVTEKRGSFKNWTVLLAIMAFSLSLLGTFLVRSGVLTSVHAFATDPERGVFILGFLVVTVGVSLTLYAWRAPKVGLGGKFDMVSRESMLLMNNVLLVVAAGSVLLGTLYPLLLDSLDLGKISVGPPYFNAVFIPLMLPLVFLLGVGPFARWKKSSVGDLFKKLRITLVVSIVIGVGIAAAMAHLTILTTISLFLACWVFLTVAQQFADRMAVTKANGGLLGRIRSIPASFFGMQLAHVGVAVFIVGVVMVSSFAVEKDMRMEVGDTVTIGEYTFRFDGVTEVPGPNYSAQRGHVQVMSNGKELMALYPEKRNYHSSGMPMTEAGIHTNLFRDLYVSLGEPIENGAWSVRVYYKPFVVWIWAGCVLMALGGLLAATDRRYRVLKRRKSDAAMESGVKPAQTATASDTE